MSNISIVLLNDYAGRCTTEAEAANEKGDATAGDVVQDGDPRLDPMAHSFPWAQFLIPPNLRTIDPEAGSRVEPGRLLNMLPFKVPWMQCPTFPRLDQDAHCHACLIVEPTHNSTSFPDLLLVLTELPEPGQVCIQARANTENAWHCRLLHQVWVRHSMIAAELDNGPSRVWLQKHPLSSNDFVLDPERVKKASICWHRFLRCVFLS